MGAKSKENIIYDEILKDGFISERAIRLLKRRSNNGTEFDWEWYEDNFPYGIPVTPEQGTKGLVWLRKKKRFLGERELAIIATANPSDFTFHGFTNCSHYKGFNDFQPVYGIDGMEYYVYAGKPEIYA